MNGEHIDKGTSSRLFSLNNKLLVQCKESDFVFKILVYNKKHKEIKSSAYSFTCVRRHLPRHVALLVIHSPQSIHEGTRGTDNTFGPHIKLVPYERKQHQSLLPIHLQALTRPIINLSAGSFTVME